MLPTSRSQKESNYLKKAYFIYGSPKSGKTTIASEFGDDADNKVMFFCTEAGHKFQEIYKYKTAEDKEPTAWRDFITCCKEIVTQEHDFKMLVIDTADNLWDWCSKEVKAKHGIEHESDLGFGKGYALIRDEFLGPLKYLNQIGVGLAFLSHDKTIEKELGVRKITYTTSTLPNTAAKVVHGMCDYILYFHTDLEGKRLIRTKGTETVNAGDRSGKLAPLIEMNAELLIKELEK